MEPWRFPPPSMFGSPSPAFIRYSPRPLLPMYSRANPRLLPPNFFHHPPPWTRPPPPAPEDASSIVARWEAEVSPSVTERRKALEAKKRITVIEFKKKLKRWKELLDASGTLDSQTIVQCLDLDSTLALIDPDSVHDHIITLIQLSGELYLSPTTYFVVCCLSHVAVDQEELDCLQRECTDPEILEFIKRKIARGRRRRQNHNTLPIVLPTPVSETLSHIAPADVPPSSSQTVDKSLTPPGKTVEDDTIPRQKYLDELKKASAYCQSRLGLLKKLKILREARVNQFRNQGKLLPVELDMAFEKKRSSIQADVESMLQAIRKLEERFKALSHWDTYLLPRGAMEGHEPGDPSRHPASRLPITWELPPCRADSSS
ncbi:unnamed protein product [Mesocestoides corti]|uniref:Uncharacterized protein n=1 Tax=Mesocestoides corti TaxID=53468 RepID=A0A158QU19_MESCO|nr:unnamed protein product [Mesocestoides corti]